MACAERALILCIYRGMLWIRAKDSLFKQALSCKNSIHSLCIKKNRILSTWRAEWLTSKPNIYRRYIKL
jgi:hypothetical protein